MNRASFIHRARQVASVGLLGALIGGAFASAPLSLGIGAAAVGAEELGAFLGLILGLVLVARHAL